MPVVTMMVHPKGLHPLQAAKAWNKHKEEGMSLNSILTEGEVVNMEGNAVRCVCVCVCHVCCFP